MLLKWKSGEDVIVSWHKSLPRSQNEVKAQPQYQKIVLVILHDPSPFFSSPSSTTSRHSSAHWLQEPSFSHNKLLLSLESSLQLSLRPWKPLSLPFTQLIPTYSILGSLVFLFFSLHRSHGYYDTEVRTFPLNHCL